MRRTAPQVGDFTYYDARFHDPNADADDMVKTIACTDPA